ncbi:MAG: FAD-binding oxidoreductase [bacterium]|nr:FAD-binding oxidoreductase [bacterium]
MVYFANSDFKMTKSLVIENQSLNNKFRLIKFRLSDGVWSFQAGQFVIIKISNKIFRDYSVASLPEKLPFWETILDITPDGPGCKYLSRLKPGDTIETSAPIGTFIINPVFNNYLMIATGSGIASIKPMIEELSKNKKNKITFLWGLRYEEDIFYPKLFEKNIVLSKPNERWSGKIGHVTDHLVKADAAYLCGNQAMITDVTKALIKMGMPQKKIYFEKYF